ncbi:MAG TPA: ATP-dependent DNA ligase [Verrucomicrobiae bacterium]|nr:ATP-dependent DNA ligase [Verrucomicrobiae bacterium]
MSAFKVHFRKGGVFLPRVGLWLDSHEPQPAGTVFISHAHSDHTELHREIIVSAPTSQLMRARMSGEWMEHVLPFGQPWNFSGGELNSQITLLPAGHIFGSAMAWIKAENESLLYTGDFKLRPGLSAEKCEPRHADVLIMETTYGRPQYRFPPSDEVIQGVIRFCREALDNEETPVLLGYSLGKSQELLCGLGDAGLPIMLHGTVHKLTKIYEQFGRCFPPYEKYDADSARGKVLLCPPNVAGSAMLRNLGRTRAAVLTGWAVDPNCRFRYQAHAAFPLSDHADFPDLVEFVKQVRPKKVYTLHGFAAEFAQTLRDLGFDAQPLSEQDQLALPLNLAPAKPNNRKKSVAPAELKETATTPFPPGEPFHRFAETCARIATTTKKLEKTAILAEYLKPLQPQSLAAASVWFTGNPFPPSQNKTLQLGWALIRDALCGAANLDQAEFGQIYLKHSDLGEASFEILSRLPEKDTCFGSISSTEQFLEQILTARGPTGKLPLLTSAFVCCTPIEAKFLTKILTGDLRIGLKEGLVEEAIAKAFDAPLDHIKRVNLLVGNIGEAAVLAAHKQLPSATLLPFRAVKYMLASPEETAADIWNRVLAWHAPEANSSAEPLPNLDLPKPQITVWVEDKYDGIRAQIHRVGKTAAIFSRDLKEITRSFEELAETARLLPDDFILDGEIVAMRGEEILPYAELQRRLGRREADLFMREQIPVQFIAFDLLWRNGQNLLEKPLSDRRAQLESTLGRDAFQRAPNISSGAPEPQSFRPAQITNASSGLEIEAAFTAARARNNEGLIIKDPASVYVPGRRGLAWLKLKKAYATLDCVVVGAEYGHGKRRSVLSDYTFAVRDENSGELKTIGKAFTGLTDVEIARLTQHFLKRVVFQRGRYFAVEPDTVLEIAFDLLQPSPRHTSGLAMRFPRIVRIRTDKTLAEIDTLATARKIADSKNGEKV